MGRKIEYTVCKVERRLLKERKYYSTAFVEEWFLQHNDLAEWKRLHFINIINGLKPRNSKVDYLDCKVDDITPSNETKEKVTFALFALCGFA